MINLLSSEIAMRKNDRLKEGVIFFILLWSPCINCFSQTSSQGPLNPSNAQEQTAGCLSCPGTSWFNPSAVLMQDNVNTTTQLGEYGFCFQSSCYYSRALIVNAFGFSIPGNAGIKGIKAEVLRNADINGAIIDSMVYLLKNGALSGNNKASNVYWPNNSPFYAEYGDSTDLWDTMWTPTEINNGDFGFYFKPENMISGPPNFFATASIDHIRITVYFETVTGIIQNQSSDELLNVIYDAPNNLISVITGKGDEGHATINVIDLLGNAVFQKKITSSQSNLQVKIDCSNFSNGLYFISYETDKMRLVRKILKEH